MNDIERAKIAEIRENIAYSKRFGTQFSGNTAQTGWLLDLLASETKRAEQEEQDAEGLEEFCRKAQKLAVEIVWGVKAGEATSPENTYIAGIGGIEQAFNILKQQLSEASTLSARLQAERDQLFGEVERLKREADENDSELQVSKHRIERLSEESLERADRVRRLREAVNQKVTWHPTPSADWQDGYDVVTESMKILIDSILGEPTEKPDSLAGPVAGTTDATGERGEIRCPQCNGKLERVVYPLRSIRNEYHFNAVRPGDYCCKACKGTEAWSGYKYFWKSELSQGAHISDPASVLNDGGSGKGREDK